MQERKLKQSTRSTQTNIALPPVLPQELEELLRRFKLIHEDHDISVSAHCTSSPVTQKPQFITKSFSRITSMVSNTSGKLVFSSKISRNGHILIPDLHPLIY